MNLLHSLVENSAQRVPERVALCARDSAITYAELWQELTNIGQGLAGLGLGRQDRIAVYLPKQKEAVTAMFAASFSAAVFVPINPVLKAAQVRHILQDSGARMLVTNSSRLASLTQDLGQCPSLSHVLLVGSEEFEHTPGVTVVPWAELDSAPNRSVTGVVDADVAAILYTSGSTGKPKGVVLSHRNMVSGAQSVASYLRNVEDDCLLAALPFSFDYGFSQLSTAFLVGARVALMDYLVPRDILMAAQRFGVTGLAAVPPLWIQLAKLNWPQDVVQNLRYLTNSGGAMPQTTLRRLREALPSTKVFLMYGLTEAFRSTYLPPEQVDLRPTSIGKSIPNAEILVVRPDGSECASGEPGELVHRGVHVALGYWNDPDRTAQRFRPTPGRPAELPISELAVWSGDTVQKDDEGYLYFVGRHDEMIKTSGYRVSPSEIEEAVYGTDMVAEVVAIGVQHPILGQAIVVAAVAPAPDESKTVALLAALRRELPAYMIPAHVEWFHSLPRNPNGKIDRKALAQRFASLFEDGRV